MNNMSFHIETVEFEGESYSAGDVLHPGGEWGAWGDHVILGFATDQVPIEVKLARPYAYVSGAGTTGPTVLQGCEVYTMPLKHVAKWKRQGNGGFRT